MKINIKYNNKNKVKNKSGYSKIKLGKKLICLLSELKIEYTRLKNKTACKTSKIAIIKDTLELITKKRFLL